MRAAWPDFKCRIERNRLISRGRIRPMSLCSEYDVRIEYRLGQSPRVFVEHPQLRRREENPDEPIPHVYTGNEPCLYLARAQEWRPHMRIAGTIMGWLHLWLLHYELWHATGTWHGGGVHPPRGSKDGRR